MPIDCLTKFQHIRLKKNDPTQYYFLCLTLVVFTAFIVFKERRCDNLNPNFLYPEAIP